MKNTRIENTRQIAFGYSTRCNIKCDHCVATNGSQGNGKMDLQQAKGIIQEMASVNVTGISFTAGEPFIYLNDILELIQMCRRERIYSRVVTNGFWAGTKEKSNDTVTELKVSGLSQLRISASRWHQKNINIANIVNAASSCKKFGLDYFISFVTDFSKEDDPIEQLFRDNNLKFFPEPVIYFGRADEFERPEIFTDYQPNLCGMNSYLSPELDMFACCDGAGRFKETDFLYLGNLKDSSIDELFRKKEGNRLYYLIRTMGLTNIASYLGLKASEIVKYRRCELCERLFGSHENLKILEKAAESDLTNWHR